MDARINLPGLGLSILSATFLVLLVALLQVNPLASSN
jgi:hypothetical protein